MFFIVETKKGRLEEIIMEWTWEDKNNKEIKRWLKVVGRGKEEKGNFDFIANVRSGELCFDLIVREYDENDYRLSTDLYVNGDGIKPGYGESNTGKAYDFFGNVGYCFKSAEFKNMNINEFKQFINEHLTIAIKNADDESSVGIMGSRCNLIEKASKPLIMW